jgi:hypothetical protein
VFAERRRKFLEAIGPDAVAIFLGAGAVTRSRDTTFSFPPGQRLPLPDGL